MGAKQAHATLPIGNWREITMKTKIFALGFAGALAMSSIGGAFAADPGTPSNCTNLGQFERFQVIANRSISGPSGFGQAISGQAQSGLVPGEIAAWLANPTCP
jgi:hypothetical protein